jgi:DNA invertase Pin-like site-specific DNA recombinase
MFVGYMRVYSDSDRQSTNLQRDALLAAGVDERHLFEDHAPGAKDDRRGLISARATCWSSGSWIGSAARCRTC